MVSLALEVASWVLMLSGVFFFFSGSVGLLRFPDIFCRLHAVTKADTLGLGLVALGLACRAAHWRTVFLLLIIWLLVLASGAVACQILARYSRDGHSHGAEDDHG